MTTRFCLNIVCVMAAAAWPLLAADKPKAAEVASPEHFAGAWKWNFSMPDGSEVTPKLKLKVQDGAVTGVCRVGTAEAPITNAVLQGNVISFAVVRERDGKQVITRYSGALKGDRIKGDIVSNWSGSDQTYEWSARRSDDVEGTWKWTTSFGEYRSSYTLRLKQDDDRLTGKVAGSTSENEIRRGRFRDGEISFRVERERDGLTFTNRYRGVVSGDEITGSLETDIGGEPRTNEWRAIRID